MKKIKIILFFILLIPIRIYCQTSEDSKSDKINNPENIEPNGNTDNPTNGINDPSKEKQTADPDTKQKIDEQQKSPELSEAIFEEEALKKFKIKSLDDIVKPNPLVFSFGVNLGFDSLKFLNNFPSASNYMFDNDTWSVNQYHKLWFNFSIDLRSYLYFRFNNWITYGYGTLIPYLDLDYLYLFWQYNSGSVRVGRSWYSLGNGVVFNGRLDGFEIDLVYNFFHFKSFAGYSGLLGLFCKPNNHYGLNKFDLDRSDDLVNNLIETSGIYIDFDLFSKNNIHQSHRTFIAASGMFDFFEQHFDLFYLFQLDLTHVFTDGDSSHNINTNHLGLQGEGKIFWNLYYNFETVFLFGTSPTEDSSTISLINSFYTDISLEVFIPNFIHSYITHGYSLAYGDIDKDGVIYYNDFGENNQFYYFGSYDGGYVFMPYLSNLQVIYVFWTINPFKSFGVDLTFIIKAYQYLKVFAEGIISDPEASLNEYLIGSEFDFCFLFNITHDISVYTNMGLFIRELAYREDSEKMNFKVGLGFTLSL